MSEWICGRNTVLESLVHNSAGTNKVFLAESVDRDDRIEKILRRTEAADLQLERVSNGELTKLVGTDNHQGAGAQIEDLFVADLDDFLASRAPERPRRLVVLEHIQDPVNLGKIIRTALFFGVDGLIKTRHNSAPLTSVAIKVSSGAVFRLPLIEVTNLQQTFSYLQEEGFWMVGTVPEAEQPLGSVPCDRDLAYVFGNEGKGLRRLTTELCDYLVSIPTPGEFDSLNVATAAGVVAYALQPGEEGEHESEGF